MKLKNCKRNWVNVQKMNSKLHTFVVLAYKDSPYLEECIKSLRKQTYKSNIIITTSTPSNYISAVARKNNVRLMINKNRKDIATDWNFAYDICKSKYITLAHQDDIYLPDYAEKCIYHAEKHTKNLITFTDYKEFNDSGIIENNFNVIVKKIILRSIFILKNEIKNSIFKKLLIAFGNPIPCPAVMYNKSKIGDFQFSDNFKINLDWDAWYRLTNMNGSFLFINEPLLYHRIHDDSTNIIGLRNNIRAIEDERIFRTIWPTAIAKVLIKIYKLNYKTRKELF